MRSLVHRRRIPESQQQMEEERVRAILKFDGGLEAANVGGMWW